MAIKIKIHESYRKVIAIADADLIGKKFVEGRLQLDITESFYGGQECSKEKAIKIIKEGALEDAAFDIVGKESVEAGIEVGLIEDAPGAIIKIQGIPHALSLL